MPPMNGFEQPVSDVPRDDPREGPSFLDSDFGEFTRRPRTHKAHDYERKTAGMLNALMRTRAQAPGGRADAAAFIAYGDNFAKAAGELADQDERAAKMIDFICQPSNPYVMFLIAGMPLASQLLRNHETTLAKMPRNLKRDKNRVKTPWPTVSIGKRIKFKVPLKLNFGFLKAQTYEPAALADAVFSDKRIISALRKAGINVPDA